jgi:RNA polymerase sigma factor (sigma-70 family)
MSEATLSIAAEADKTLPAHDEERVLKSRSRHSIEDLPDHSFPGRGSLHGDRAHEVGGRSTTRDGAKATHHAYESAQVERSSESERCDRFEEKQRRSIYRGKAVWMLRRYMRYSLDTGRLPSIVGREFFRTKITRHTPVTFEDRVIFVHDMETCLHRLDEFSQEVIGRIVLQEYGQEEAAHLLGCTRMTVHRVLVDALDKLSSILLRVGLIDRLHWRSEKTCQGGNSDDFLVSDCNYEE